MACRRVWLFNNRDTLRGILFHFPRFVVVSPLSVVATHIYDNANLLPFPIFYAFVICLFTQVLNEIFMNRIWTQVVVVLMVVVLLVVLNEITMSRE